MMSYAIAAVNWLITDTLKNSLKKFQNDHLG